MAVDRFRRELRDGLVRELDDIDSDAAASWVRDCFELLKLARGQGRLMSGDLSLPNYHIYADMLTAAGFIDKQGDRMTPIYYVITEKGRNFEL